MTEAPRPETASETSRQIERLVAIMARLRDPVSGCAWDIAQTPASIAPYAIEEAYEVMDAILAGDDESVPDELGDLLLQVVFQARMAEEAGRFGLGDIARRVADKMIRRHPHIFGDAAPDPAAWERGKAEERARRREFGALAGIPDHLPALLKAGKYSARAARVGFDWGTPEEALDKIGEEIEEVRRELPEASADRLEDEIGDVLFTVANLARKLGIEPEACLRRANAKFARRFGGMEAILDRRGESLAAQDLPTLEALWQEVKRGEC